MLTRQYRDARSRSHLIDIYPGLDFKDSKTWKFSYDDGEWTCPLLSMQCLANTKANRRCSRRSTVTIGYCFQHITSVADLTVDRTKMREKKTNKRYNFIGLFACMKGQNTRKIVFRKGDVIAPYLGEVIDKKKLEYYYPGEETAPYALQDSKNRYIDAACARGIGSLSNACSRRVNSNCATNAKFSLIRNRFPVVRATRDIKNGQEIFINYGRTYFARRSVHKKHETNPVNRYKKTKYKCKRR
jgi:hypothetical protein